MSASRPWLRGLAGVALPGLLASGAAVAQDQPVPPLDVELGGHVKSFFLATVPPPEAGWPAQLGMNPEPEGSGIVDLRLLGRLRLEPGWELEVHHDLVVFANSPSAVAADRAALDGGGGGGFASAGVGLVAPEAVDLSWELPSPEERSGEGNLWARGRVDRLVLRTTQGRLDLSVGRQAIGFGSGLFFTPLDLVNPFFPGTIDTEYRPGVDAARADLFMGTSGRVGVAAAYAGDWDLGGTVLQATGQGTVGVTDLLGLVGSVHGDGVLGVGVVSSAGPVGLRGDASLSLPDLLHEDGASEDRRCYSYDPAAFVLVEDPEGAFCQDLSRVVDPYVRAVVGADVRPSGTSFLAAEVYYQSLGAADAREGVLLSFDERFARGELWQTGRLYAALSASQEITPLVSGSLAIIANLGDPSALLAPGLSWSVSEEATLAAGAYLGLGEKPGEPDLTGVDPTDLDALVVESLALGSELGAIPTTAYLQLATYF